ncbi:MAG: alpha/beta hydrolase [Sporichthyaceae bacterium]
MTTDEPEAKRPLELIEPLDITEVRTGPTSRHSEVLAWSGRLGLLWTGTPGADRVVVACGGALGGVLGPAGGLYYDLGNALEPHGIGTVRVDYRRPGNLASCVFDVAVAIDVAMREGSSSFVIVGHSFGGAVAISAAAAMPDVVAAVVSLAGQSAGTDAAPELAGRPLLLLHGEADEVIPASSAHSIRRVAGHGRVVVFPATGHLLHEASEELRSRLPDWIRRSFDGGDPGDF